MRFSCWADASDCGQCRQRSSLVPRTGHAVSVQFMPPCARGATFTVRTARRISERVGMQKEMSMPAKHFAVNRKRPMHAVPIQDARIENELANVLGENGFVNVGQQALQQLWAFGAQRQGQSIADLDVDAIGGAASDDGVARPGGSRVHVGAEVEELLQTRTLRATVK